MQSGCRGQGGFLTCLVHWDISLADIFKILSKKLNEPFWAHLPSSLPVNPPRSLCSSEVAYTQVLMRAVVRGLAAGFEGRRQREVAGWTSAGNVMSCSVQLGLAHLASTDTRNATPWISLGNGRPCLPDRGVVG